MNVSTFRPELVPHRPWTVCFYSFRGGVGRTTLALSTALNLADELSGRDSQSGPPGVFVLDFDVEAPSIDEFDTFRPESPEQKGLLEYVGEYLDSGSRKPQPLREYVYRRGDKGLHRFVEPGEPQPPPSSDLSARVRHVMRAGTKGDSYIKRLAQLDWSDFYRCQHGLEFFENMRIGVKKEFGCDYMVVDSRTGLTEIGGICTGHLADAVVIVFRPTTAASEGLRAVSRAIRRREASEGRAIPRLYVASRCPTPYHNQYDPEALRVARLAVTWCEDGDSVQEWHADPDVSYEWDCWSPDVGKPALLFLREREKVPHGHRPDAFLVTPANELLALSPEQQEYALVLLWIEQMRRSATEAYS